MIELKIDPEFRDKIPPLKDEEFKQLEENILADGEVYEPICAWNGIIVDGHNRWKIVHGHPEIPYKVKEMDFADKWEAFEWMYRKQLGRRNLTDEEKTYMIGKMYEARKNTASFKGNQYTSGDGQNVHNQTRREQKDGTSGQIGKDFGITSRTVRRAEHFAQGADKADNVVPGFRDQVLSGELIVSKESVAAIRKMKSDEEVKAAVEEIRNPKRKEKNPNIEPLYEPKRSRMTAEDREIAERVRQNIENENQEFVYTIESLIDEVRKNANDYISSLKNTFVVRSTLLVGENRARAAESVDYIIKEITKIKELLV